MCMSRNSGVYYAIIFILCRIIRECNIESVAMNLNMFEMKCDMEFHRVIKLKEFEVMQRLYNKDKYNYA